MLRKINNRREDISGFRVVSERDFEILTVVILLIKTLATEVQNVGSQYKIKMQCFNLSCLLHEVLEIWMIASPFEKLKRRALTTYLPKKYPGLQPMQYLFYVLVYLPTEPLLLVNINLQRFFPIIHHIVNRHSDFVGNGKYTKCAHGTLTQTDEEEEKKWMKRGTKYLCNYIVHINH